MLRIKEPVNTITHFIGVLLSVFGLVWMVIKAIQNQSGLQLAGSIVFGVSLIALYSASTIYHWISGSEKIQIILRKIDHSMIYVLIAGTYTPITLLTLKGALGWTLFGIVWGLAILGIVLKLLWMNAPRWLYTGFYLILGWLALFFIVPLYQSLPIGGFVWLLTGGLLYTVGSIIYARKSKWLQVSVFKYHEIFHLFILGGSFSHFILVNRYLLVNF